MKQKLIAIAMLTTVYISCDKEAADTNTETKEIRNEKQAAPPAWFINNSEKLVLPLLIDLPVNLPDGNSRVATYFAEGIQKYKSQLVTSTPETYKWVFVEPQANLYDVSNKYIGTHSAGPVWYLNGTTDTIFAQHFDPARTAPSPDANSIDWLLLMPKAGKTPTGLFADVDYIQRIATVGGKAPSTPPTSLYETVSVPYTAVYRFSKKN